MIKVLHVLGSLEKGGTEAFIMNNYRNIDKSLFSFDFLLLNDSVNAYGEEIEKLGGNIYICNYNGKNKIRTVFSIVDVLKKNGSYDVIHSHLNTFNAWIMLAAKLSKIKVRISHSHAECKNRKYLYFLIERFLIKSMSNCWIACSDLAGKTLYGENFFKKKGKVIKNGIEVDKFIVDYKDEVNRLKSEFEICNEFVVGNISRFDKNKNIEFVVKTFYEFLKLKPNSVLILGGVDGGMLDYIKDYVKKLGIEGRVRFIGKRDDMEICLQLIDMYLFPSISEGLGIAILEAQASGIFSLVSNTVPKTVDSNLNLIKFLDLSSNAEFWAKTMYNNLDYVKPSSKEIKKAFLKKGYCIQQSVKEMEKLYQGD